MNICVGISCIPIPHIRATMQPMARRSAPNTNRLHLEYLHKHMEYITFSKIIIRKTFNIIISQTDGMVLFLFEVQNIFTDIWNNPSPHLN